MYDLTLRSRKKHKNLINNKTKPQPDVYFCSVLSVMGKMRYVLRSQHHWCVFQLFFWLTCRSHTRYV